MVLNDISGRDTFPGTSKRRKIPKLPFILLILALIAFSGWALAGRIWVESSAAEYGQSEYSIKACDDFIKITPQAGAGAEVSTIKSLSVKDFNVKACTGKTITVRLFDSTNSQMNLFWTNNPSTILNQLVLTISGSGPNYTVSSNGASISLTGTSDVSSTNNPDLLITYTSATGRYVFTFTNPLADVSAFSNLTIQTQ